MSEKTITDGLFALKDENYRRFHAKLIPDIPIDNIIGVRTPVLRKYAKEVAKLPETNIFLESLPHIYYEENNLHGALLSLLYPKDIIAFMEQLERFLPYVDNWATCDMLSPKIFKKHLSYVYERVQKWLQSDAVYTIRLIFAVGTGNNAKVYVIELNQETNPHKYICSLIIDHPVPTT